MFSDLTPNEPSVRPLSTQVEREGILRMLERSEPE
jgi:hypothetical protein